MMDVLTYETCWALNNEIKSKWHQVGLSLFNYKDDARSNEHKTHITIQNNFNYNKQNETIFYLFISKTLYMFQAVPPPIIRSTELHTQLQVLSPLRSISATTPASSSTGDNTWSCVYSYVLLMMGRGTAWNMYSVLEMNKSKIVSSCWL